MWFLLWLVPVIVILMFIIIICVKAILFKPKVKHMPAQGNKGSHGEQGNVKSVINISKKSIKINNERAIKNFQALIRCETITPETNDQSSPYEKHFEKFRALLPKLYPLLHEHCSFERVGHGGLLFHWKGRQSQKPSVFMSHYDVVPAQEDKWQKPPFSGIYENGEIWGRGTLDTKGTLCAALEAAETLIAQGFVPENDIYFAFGGDEELISDDAPAIVELLKSRGVFPALVLDEGGAIVENVFPGVKGAIALIGTGEKGRLNVKYTVSGLGGHASAPPIKTPIGTLARTVLKIEKHPFKAHICEPVKQMFDILGRHSTFMYRLIFANMCCFKGLFTWICKKSGGELNALVRTTCAFTQMQGSPASNVIPPTASVTANMRLMSPDTENSVMAKLKEIVNDDNISLVCNNGVDPSPFSNTDTEGYNRVCNAIGTIWPEAIISPYLMIAASDSRHFCKISDAVFRFSAMKMSRDDRGRIHGHDERIKDEQFFEAIMFYQKIISSS